MMRCEIIRLPVTPIERLGAKFAAAMHIPDPSLLYTLMGAAAANMIEGPPVWLMLVGAPGCGKTELLNSLLEVPHIVEVANISNESAFLSGTPVKDKSASATGGLFCQIGPAGGMVINDFTSILAKPRDLFGAIMAIFREAYSGRWTRTIGGEGGRNITWRGKLAMFAGVTNKIDQLHQLSAELGERWIYCRYEPKDNEFAACKLISERAPNFRDTLRTHVKAFFEELGMSFTQPQPARELVLDELVKLHTLSVFGTRCRSGVSRDQYQRDKEITSARETELEPRFYAVLSQLLLGMDRIGVQEALRWRLLGKVAMDSMPLLRKLVIQAAATTRPTAGQLQTVLGCSLGVTKRTIEDLTVHGIIVPGGERIALTSWAAESYATFFGT